MDKLLVVGSGLLGSKAIEIGKKSYTVYGTYNKTYKNGLIQLNVVNQKAVSRTIERLRPDFVLDTHALNNLDFCETHHAAAWDINVNGSRNVAKACKKINAKYIYISSDYVFSGKKRVYSENDNPDPINYYGKTKSAAEEMLKSLDINMIIIRTSAIYGAISSTGKESFVQWLIQNLKKGNEVQIMTDIFSSPTLNSELADIAFNLYELGYEGIFHIVGRDNISKYEFATMISREFGLNQNLIKPTTSSQIFGSQKIRPLRVRLSTNKIKKIIGKPPIGAKAGLRILHKSM
jgi:dTDP-4-dehydrorhamnose reductase